MVNITENQVKYIYNNFFCIYNKNENQIETDNKENVYLYDSLLYSFDYLGIYMKENEIYEIIENYNFNKTSSISFEEFIQIIKDKMYYLINEEEIQKYFDIFKNKDGNINIDLLYNFLLEYETDIKSIKSFISCLQNDKGEIDYKSFYSIFIGFIKG